jgi:hypothetical protein
MNRPERTLLGAILTLLTIYHANCQSALDRRWSCGDIIEKSNDAKSNIFEKNIYTDSISIYVEVDYDLFLKMGGHIDQVYARLLEMEEIVQALYTKENIPIFIDKVKIWTSKSAYSLNSIADLLLDFREHRLNNFPGNIALLLTGNPQFEGGIAFRDGICDRSKAFAVCHITDDYNNYPGYSKDIHVISHELGHIFGSAHTHDCVWGPEKNQPIDGCSFTANCGPGDIPSLGGTIMSYCHDSPVGVDFKLGFGPEPGDLMRSHYINCKSSHASQCETAEVIHSSGTFAITEEMKGNGASDPSASNAKWYTFMAPASGTITIESCNQGVDTRMNLYHGTCGQLDLMNSSDDDCLSGDGYYLAASLVNIAIDSNTQIFIEWTDQWSSEPFSFTFEYSPLTDPCQKFEDLYIHIDSQMDYYSLQDIKYSGKIDTTGSLRIVTPSSVSFENGFEITEHGQLLVSIGDCASMLNEK